MIKLIKGFLWQAFSIYGGGFASLLLIPHLARTLKPVSFGDLSIAQSFAAILSLLMDFGFIYTGANRVAKTKALHGEKLGDLIAVMFVSKVIIHAIFVVGVVLLYKFTGLVPLEPALFWSAVMWAFSFAFVPTWIAWGLEDHKTYAWLEMAPKYVSLIMVLILVNRPSENYLVLVIQGSAMLATATFGWAYFLKKFSPRKQVSAILKSSAQMLPDLVPMFVYRVTANAYLNLPTYLLGLISDSLNVAVYSAADRAFKPLLTLTEPLLRVLIPNLTKSVLFRGNGVIKRKVFASLLAVVALAGFLVFLMYCLSNPILLLLLGREFLAAVDYAPLQVFRTLVLILPLHAVSKMLLVAFVGSLSTRCSIIAAGTQFFSLSLMLMLSMYFSMRLDGYLMAIIVLVSQLTTMILAGLATSYCLAGGKLKFDGLRRFRSLYMREEGNSSE